VISKRSPADLQPVFEAIVDNTKAVLKDNQV
jgi:hypothetical protein